MNCESVRGTVDKYDIIFSPPIGRGAFGTVHEGKDTDTGEKIAAKQLIIGGNADMLKTARQEIQLIGDLQNHDNIVKLLGHYFTAELGWIFLEYCDLGNLNFYLMERPNLGMEGKVRIMHQSACAVRFMHSQNPSIVHRDIKPENILLKQVNGEDTVKLSDFGMSKITNDNSMMSTQCGSQFFMAPEILVESEEVKYDASVDVFVS